MCTGYVGENVRLGLDGQPGLSHAHTRPPLLLAMSDPKEALEEKCAQTAKCRPLLEELQKCAARVEARGEENTETCIQELFDLQPCIDACVRPHCCVGGGIDCVGRQALVPKTEIIKDPAPALISGTDAAPP